MSILSDTLFKVRRPEYVEDIKRIVSVAYDHGIQLTYRQAEDAWEMYSESMAAGWMMLPEDDDQLWNLIGE